MLKQMVYGNHWDLKGYWTFIISKDGYRILRE
jgi:hypothetical protein